MNPEDENKNEVPQQPEGQPPYQNPAQPYGQPPYQGPAQPYGQSPYQNPAQPYGQSPYQNPTPPYGQSPYQNPAQPYGQSPYQNPAQPYGQSPYQNPIPPYGQSPYQNPTPPYGQSPYSPEMQEKAARSRLRSVGNHASLMPIFVTLFQFVAVIIVFAVWMAFNIKHLMPIFRRGSNSVMKYFTSQSNTLVFLTILSVILGMVLTILVARPTLGKKIFGAWKRPKWTAPGFAKCLVLLFGIAGAANLYVLGLETLCKTTGLKLSSPDINLSGNKSSDILLLAYVCVIGPLMEETLFRGMILQSLRPWGDRLAIIVSAVLFGITHMNLYQGVPAALLGLLFGFVAVKSESIVPTAIMHILYNSLSMAMALAGIETNSLLRYGYIVFLALAVIGSIFLFALRRIDFSGIGSQPASPVPVVEHPYRVVFLQSVAFWISIALFILCSVLLVGAVSSPSF